MFNWSKKASPLPEPVNGVMMGLDVNSTRVRAAGFRDGRRVPTVLEDPYDDLMLALSMGQRDLVMGRPAHRLLRVAPHLVCQGYLGMLGDNHSWQHAKHRIDPTYAVHFAFDRLRQLVRDCDGLAIGLPVYFKADQVAKLRPIIEAVKFPSPCMATLPLAIAADLAHQVMPEPPATEGVVPLSKKELHLHDPRYLLLVDVDAHALTFSLIERQAEQVNLKNSLSIPRWNMLAWKERLLDAIADQCVRSCRRDPRDNGEAEQMLYDQLDEAMERTRQNQRVDLTVRIHHWFQNLIIQPTDIQRFAAEPLRQTLEMVEAFLHQQYVTEPVGAIWCTSAAGRLPGLLEGLMRFMPLGCDHRLLSGDAGAVAMAHLAIRSREGLLPRGFLDASIPFDLRVNHHASKMDAARPNKAQPR